MEHVFSVSRTRDIKSFKRDNTVDVSPPSLVAPNSLPVGSGISITGSTPKGGIVDVVNNFYWTYSKLIDSRREAPRIILKEKRLKANALISQLKYSFGVARSNVTAAINAAPDSIKNPITTFLNKSGVAGATRSATQYASDLVGQLSFLQDNNDVYTDNPYLLPYQNLYITEPTGWEFYLPYFNDYKNNQSNTFSQDMGGNPFLSVLKGAADLATDIAEITNVLRSPTQITFVERAKFYNYPAEGDEFAFSFPLINTGSATFNDVVRNWELLFLLLYNNKPSRKNVNIVEPPVLYQVEIPGSKFLPFCYISSMNVEFKGTRREIRFDLSVTDNLNVETGVQVPGVNNAINQIVGFNNQNIRREISTIIPDAYVITFNIKSLLPESKNFMYSVLNKNPIVSTNTLGVPINSVLNPFLDSARQNSNSPVNNPNDTSIPPGGVNSDPIQRIQPFPFPQVPQ